MSSAIRDRLTAQFSDRCDQKTANEAELQAIEGTAPLPGNDLYLLAASAGGRPATGRPA